jgi:hypothetical protein
MPRPDQPMRVRLDRDELVTLIYALEAVIEGYQYDGGLVLAEKEMALKAKLDRWNRDYCLHGKRHA